MKKLCFMAVVAVLAMMVSCNSEKPEEQQAQNPEEKVALEAEQPSGIQALRLGRTLALYGYKYESAEALIEAANILADVKMAALEVAVTRGGKAEDDGEADEARSFEPEALLASAKEMAGEDAALLAMIKRVEEKLAAAESSERGATACSGRSHEDRVFGGDFDDYKVEFAGGELAVCTVIGDGSTDLDLYITDEDYNLVTEDVDYTDNCYCAWRPDTTATYVIRIVNRGEVKNHYTIAVN